MLVILLLGLSNNICDSNINSTTAINHGMVVHLRVRAAASSYASGMYFTANMHHFVLGFINYS